MPEELIVKHCSPTLAGIKTGSIFSCVFEDDEDLKTTLSTLNGLLRCHGLRAVPLKYTKGGGHAIVYIYRPQMLRNDISESQAECILSSFGYKTGNANVCVAQLIQRLKDTKPECFPHEIGLFLGYPPEDVQGFIDNKAKGCKLCGMWKVYGDVSSARRKFTQYRECSETCYKRWKAAGSIEGLMLSL